MLQSVVWFLTLKAVRWMGIGLVVLVMGAVGVVYVGSEMRIKRAYDVAPMALRASSPSAANGERLATLMGCKSCHGESGGVLLNQPIVGVLVTPNLTRVGHEYSDAELVRVIRAGVKRDGTSAVAMPTDSYAWLADDDVADIVAWVRSLKTLPDHQPSETRWGPLGRIAAMMGGMPFSADLTHDAKPPATRPSGAATGNYLAKVACLHCHRVNTEHEVRPGTIAPPLGPMAQSYDLAQFTQLMRTGIGIGDRQLGLMSEVARDSFTHFSDEEIAALRAYLTSEGAEDNADAKAIRP